MLKENQAVNTLPLRQTCVSRNEARARASLGAMLAAMSLGAAPAHAGNAAAPAAEAETALPAVRVESVREAGQTGYQPGMTTIGKLPQLPRDIPQSLTIVPEPLMNDRNADSFKEALRNVAGLTFSAGEGGRVGDNMTLRGFTVFGDLYLDGMRDVAQYNREIFNVERVEVLRGAASMLFGRGSAGGVINQASKQPGLLDEGRAAFTLGSYRHRRFTMDVNRVVGQDAAFRLNAMQTATGSFREGVTQERWGIAPSFRWGIGTRNEFMLSWYRTQDDNVPDYGQPYFQGRPVPVPVTRFYGMAATDFERYDTSVLTGSWIHRFDDGATLKTVLRKGRYQRDLWAVAPRLAAGTTVLSDATVVNRQRQARGGDERPITSQTDYSFKVTTGPVVHQLLIGMELASENTWRWQYPAGAANPATTLGSPDAWPVVGAGYQNTARINDTTFRARTRGLYAQDFMELGRYWKLLVGARHDDFRVDIDNPTGADFARRDRVWSWRSGLSWQPDDIVSYYVSYGTSFNPSGDLYSLDAPGSNTPPEENRNLELGGKWELLDGNLSLRTALFRTEKTNERNTDLSNPTVYLLSGRRHTQGVEFEAAGRMSSRWEIFTGLALMRSRIDVPATTATAAATIAANAANVGNWPQYTGPYTGNVWSTYRLDGGWRVGGGVELMSKRYANNNNQTVVPGYRRWDAMISWEQRAYSIRVNVLNLFDTRYYEGVYTGHVIPGATRTLQTTFEAKF